MVPHWVKIAGLVGGAVGAVAATIASGGSALVAVLVGLGSLTTGLSGLYITAPVAKRPTPPAGVAPLL